MESLRHNQLCKNDYLGVMKVLYKLPSTRSHQDSSLKLNYKLDKTQCPGKEELLELIVQYISTVRFIGSRESIILPAMFSFVK